MELISIYSAVLFILFFIIYYIINPKYRIIFLALLSCGFIASFGLILLIYILFYSLINYFIGLKIASSRFRKTLFRTGIILNLLQIVLLKYADFTLNPLFHLFDLDLDITRISDLIIPIGVSYFTIQGIGYLINIYMRWEKPETNILHFLLYICFFPKFLSGPVERSNHFLPQLKKPNRQDNNDIILGLRIALFGFFKKVIIANHLATFVNNVYATPELIEGRFVWLLFFIQPLYLYFDFSGYTDIAIGFAKVFGIDLMPNFNRPFLSENITTFWRRFHISLSSWFNDYIFKQASFRFRKLKSHAATIALFITWILFGIWHGAGWNFMVLGLVQAIAISYEYFTKKQRTNLFSKVPVILRAWTGRLFTYLFFGWSLTFFFSPNLSVTFELFHKLTNSSATPQNPVLLEPLLFGLFFAVIILVIEVLENDCMSFFKRLMTQWNEYRVFRIILYYAMTFLIISQMSGNMTFVYQMF